MPSGKAANNPPLVREIWLIRTGRNHNRHGKHPRSINKLRQC
jgi:hypothetical protein